MPRNSNAMSRLYYAVLGGFMFGSGITGIIVAVAIPGVPIEGWLFAVLFAGFGIVLVAVEAHRALMETLLVSKKIEELKQPA